MSSSTYMLDTNMFSYIASGNSPAARLEWFRLSRARSTTVCISAITEAEVRYGMAKRALSRQRVDALERLFANLQILPWGSEEAAAYARAKADLEARGITLSAMDLLIAAHAIAAGAILVTRDRSFEHVPHIPKVTNWATDL